MEVALHEEMFVNNKYSITYGTNKQALFTIVDEEYQGNNGLGRVNRITILVRELDDTGKVTNASLRSAVIGMGDAIAGVRSDNPALRGKVMTHENMEECTVVLYE